MLMTFEEWSLLVKHHDLTYAYSDDNSVWRRGQASYNLIVSESASFPRSEVAAVWNTMVDSFLIPEARQPFYWSAVAPAVADASSGAQDKTEGEKGDGIPQA
jgi:hypothetical protein